MSTAPQATPYGAQQFLLDDHAGTLFPMHTSYVLASSAFADLSNALSELLLRPGSDHAFQVQLPCYAAKHGFHLRRTMKLDPLAEHFVYDFVYRNRAKWRSDHLPARRSFGYRFNQGRPISIGSAYSDFRGAVASARQTYRFSGVCDIASYFNSIYHHDLVNWTRQLQVTPVDTEALGLFLRGIAAGRSVDCLPQGIYPCKVIGSEFLKDIDTSMRLRSSLYLRFMDDIYWFDDSEHVVLADFLVLQKMLGAKGLSVNPEKTRLGISAIVNAPQQLDEIKAGLLQIRNRRIHDVSGSDLWAQDEEEDDSYDEDDSDIEQEDDTELALTDEQTSYLINLLKNADIAEQDAILVLSLLEQQWESVLPRMASLLQRFPSLGRGFYSFSIRVPDAQALSDVVLTFLRQSSIVTEDLLFWLTRLTEDRLMSSPNTATILRALSEHPSATPLTAAKLLEIPDQRYGLPDLRHERLRTGASDWPAWAAAVGCRLEAPANRNHVLAYFANGSSLNRLVADCVRSLS
jgi:hypothetical protein